VGERNDVEGVDVIIVDHCPRTLVFGARLSLGSCEAACTSASALTESRKSETASHLATAAARIRPPGLTADHEAGLPGQLPLGVGGGGLSERGLENRLGLRGAERPIRARDKSDVLQKLVGKVTALEEEEPREGLRGRRSHRHPKNAKTSPWVEGDWWVVVVGLIQGYK
jgi:hypothetical protein